MTTMYDKRNYLFHLSALAQAVDHGLELRKIHRALQFNQKPRLRTYIELNTRMKEKATNKFKVMFF